MPTSAVQRPTPARRREAKSTVPARVERFGGDALLKMKELALYLGYEKGSRPEESARKWAVTNGVRIGKRGPFNVVKLRDAERVVFEGKSDLEERALAASARRRGGVTHGR
jgi:hypothetical protein